ncbi:MAG TPA: hypothetical protein VHB20_19190 [Verrucomicrobiae bacterium]|nr:hypothetical protein [Verrucomicrobiae bacterium]
MSDRAGAESVVDATTLNGKVLCGYQGWFNTPCDGEGSDFGHWGHGLGGPDGHFVVDMWPDVSEYAPEDLCAVPGLKMPDGAEAKLYSGSALGPALRHCQWMREYGIDGVFVSRFEGETLSPQRLRHINHVLENVREGCHREGRVWAMMLDVTMGPGATTATVINDWKFLCDTEKVRDDSRYLHQNGKPVVLLWGLGFTDRPWTPAQGEELIRFFQDDPRYGGVYLLGGIDPGWRTLRGGSRTDPAWARVYRMFDAISPWDAGRYRDEASMDRVRTNSWEGDLAELKPLGKGYMPTAFPGFSWDNLRRKAPGTTTIARRKGEFYWRQFAIFRELGIRSVFVGMFDEVNEGTAIYKVANATPAGQNFVTYEGMPSDWYLRLTGAATRMIRGEAPLSQHIPSALTDFAFDTTISQRILENYLGRSISFTELLTHPQDTDNMRMLLDSKAKFIGRALMMWGREQNLSNYLHEAKPYAAKLHEADPDMILQAAEFEIVTKGVETIALPEFVLREFGQTPTNRNFHYADMLYEDGRQVDHWGKGSSVPDMSRLETRMWFYYLATCYIDAGIEAIHFGQVGLMDWNDPGHAGWRDMLGRVRAYARTHARRHLLLCDAHTPTGGYVEDGKLLFDFHSFPLRIVGVEGQPHHGVLQVGYADSIFKRSKGGVTPSGWACDHLPYLVEFDNFGSHNPGKPSKSPYIWGWDEITWFALTPEAERNDWLRYAWRWVGDTDPVGHLEMPGSRVLRTGQADGPKWYWANRRSDACPQGFNTEDTIRDLWGAK